MPRFDTVTLPAYWASYLVNGDASSLRDNEQSEIDAHLAREGYTVLSTVEDSERFTWSFQLHGGNCQGGEVCDYTVQYLNEVEDSEFDPNYLNREED